VYLSEVYMPRGEYYFKPPAFVQRFLERTLNDTRDMEIAWLYWNIVTTQYPALIALFTVLPPSNILGAAYLVVFNVLYLQRFILAMHYSTHRRLFKRGAFPGSELVNRFNIVLVAPVFGIPCNTYWLHHVVMHHVDNNEWNKDLSATEAYQRDNILHWIVYWVRFMVGSWVELPYYALKKRRWDLFAGCAGGMGASLATYWYLHALNPIAAFWTVAMPFLVVSTAMMFGNWSQHAFVKPDDPRCNFGLAYTVVNHPDNQRSYNDGFHTLHHVNSQIHWSEFPNKFVEKLGEHAEKDALVFDGIGFFDVGFALFFHRHGFLADRYVNVGQKKRTRDEVIALLKDRLKPIKFDKEKEASKKVK
jgi:fatty acid desaturase